MKNRAQREAAQLEAEAEAEAVAAVAESIAAEEALREWLGVTPKPPPLAK